MKKLSILGILLLLTLFGCSKQSVFKTETFTLNGRLLFGAARIEDPSHPQGKECSGRGGYSDINGNIPIVVKDGAGNIMATGKTESGKYQLVSPSEYKNIFQCMFAFYPIALPKSDFYVISLANRGAITLSFEELTNDNWTVEFAIGGD